MKPKFCKSSAGSLLLLALCLTRCGGGSAPSPQPLVVTTASLPNGTAWVAYNQTIKATGGIGPFTWTVKSGSLPHNLTLGNSPTNAVTVSGTPDTGVQALPFTIQVTDSEGHTALQSYAVSILFEPDTLVASAQSLSFGEQLEGTPSSPQVLTLTNNGTSPLVIVDVATGAAEFVPTNTCGASIVGGASCTVSVTFSPSALGPQSSALTITDNSVGSPHSYSLDGMGVTQGPNATFSSGTSYSFSTSPGVPSLPQHVILVNFGSATLNVTSVTTTAQFSETDTCVGSIAPGNSCSITVTFTPTSSGTIQGSISVDDNAPASPQSVSLVGTSTPGQCTTKGGFCSSSLQCCAGLRCVFTGGILRPAYRCE